MDEAKSTKVPDIGSHVDDEPWGPTQVLVYALFEHVEALFQGALCDYRSAHTHILRERKKIEKIVF